MADFNMGGYGGQMGDRESSLFIYHQKLADIIANIVANKATGQREVAKSQMISLALYAKTVADGLDFDDKGEPEKPALAYIERLRTETDLDKLWVIMTAQLKRAKLTPQIQISGGVSYYSRLKRSGALD